VSAGILTPLLVIINEYLPKLETLLPTVNSFVTNGIFPLVILLDKNGKVVGEKGYANISAEDYIQAIHSMDN